jgi:hypothetical protein
MKVQYVGASDEQIQWGNNDDPREVLQEGTEYELLDKEVHSWHTKYVLKDFPEMKFNSVCFVDVV